MSVPGSCTVSTVFTAAARSSRLGPLLPFIALSLAAAAVLVAAPLAGWPAVVRLPAVLVPAIVLAIGAVRPWRWTRAEWGALAEWTPRGRTIWVGAAVTGLVLSWIVLARFQSAEINAVDFTVYFDRPCYQTAHGRLLFVETADFPQFSWQSSLAHHAYWAMVPLCSLYAAHATPYWLLAFSVVAVVAGAVHTLRIMRHLGVPGVLATATAVAFVLNDNTARTLNYGFHPEVLYAWFIPWLLEAALKGRRLQFLAAGVAAVLVKEDAAMPLIAASVALALAPGHRRQLQAVWLIVPPVLALANLAFYYMVVVPAVTVQGIPAYAHFWLSYGDTPMRALAGMITHPLRLAADVATSRFFSLVITPHLFLPVIGWRWAAGIVPIVALYSAADDPQLREFGIYYAMPLVPFLVIAASIGAMTLARRVITDPGRGATAAALLVVAGAVLVGSGDRGYTVRPWKQAVAAVPGAVRALETERSVLVQSGLYPHAGYDARVQLLTRVTADDPRFAGAAILISPETGAYPLTAADIKLLLLHPRVEALPGGLFVVRGRPAGHGKRHHRD